MNFLISTAVLFLAALIIFCQRCQSQQQLSTITLFRVGFVGQSLAMTCNVNQTGAAQWGQLTDSGVGAFFRIPTSESGGVSASTPTELGYTFIIVSLEKKLAGSYSLRFDGSASAACIIYLAVIDVVIDAVNRNDAIVGGDLISLTCTLTVDAQRLLSVYSSITIHVIISDDTGYVWNVSTFGKDATVNLNAQVPSTVAQTQYFCTALYNNLYKQVNTTVFRVSYPVRNVTLNVSNNTQLAVSDVISCHSDAYPVANIFVWEYFENSSRWSAFSAANVPTLILLSAGNITIRCTAFNVIRNVTNQATSSGVRLEVLLLESTSVNLASDPGTLSTGASIGIGVVIGVSCGVLIETAIILTIYCVRRKRRTHQGVIADQSDVDLDPGRNNRNLVPANYDDLTQVNNQNRQDRHPPTTGIDSIAYETLELNNVHGDRSLYTSLENTTTASDRSTYVNNTQLGLGLEVPLSNVTYLNTPESPESSPDLYGDVGHSRTYANVRN